MTPLAAPSVTALAMGDPLRAPLLLHELEQRYLLWDAFVGGQRRVDLHPIVLPEPLHRRAVAAAESVARAIGRAAARAHDERDERARYRLPPSAERLAEASRFAGDDAGLARVDLLLREDGELCACEVNADCPGGHNEALGLPRLARGAGFARGYDPTNVVAALARRLAVLARKPDGEPGVVGIVYATAYAEDLQVCALVRRELRQLGVEVVLAPPTAPVRGEDGSVSIRGVPIRVLYRYFPAEYMEGQANVGGLAEAIAAKNVRTLSSFAHVYAQSKLSFARAHALAPTLDAADRDAVTRHVPETFDLLDVPESTLRRDRAEWVVKRAYGRVGEDVLVGTVVPADAWPLALDAALADRRAGESWIAQRFVPQRAIETPWGPRFLTLGAYVLDGSFVGYFARVTPQSHVGHDALVLPVFVQGDESP